MAGMVERLALGRIAQGSQGGAAAGMALRWRPGGSLRAMRHGRAKNTLAALFHPRSPLP